MAMGALPYILSNAKKGDFLVGSSVGGRGDVDVCHLLFPNDMLIPCDANLSGEILKGYSCDEVYLGEAFLVMFFILTTKEDWVAEVWEQEGEKKCWNSHFSRQFHDWELEEVELFLGNCNHNLLTKTLGIKWFD
ncbi:hypothetical protein CK203_043127 [Vitis vinifera]|uniref:Uncharacterized protein n=1 Tax=Vitis vinifera TaxID=29760 RepID=A0A438H3A0_VITVI|nr:hypothetical protein CK203_043127 [Vitis vinifera]